MYSTGTVCAPAPRCLVCGRNGPTYPVRVPEIVNFSSKSFAARRCGVLHSCAVALTRHGAVMSSCTGRSESPSGSFASLREKTYQKGAGT